MKLNYITRRWWDAKCFSAGVLGGSREAANAEGWSCDDAWLARRCRTIFWKRFLLSLFRRGYCLSLPHLRP